MSLVIEALYIVVRVSTVNQRLAGGIDAFRGLCPNRTFVTDGELAGCGFMNFDDAERFANKLVRAGFDSQAEHPDAEIVLVDMKDGPSSPSDWCHFEQIPYPGRPGLTLATVRLKDGAVVEPKAYEGWDRESNLNLSYQTSPTPSLEELEFVETRNGVDTYRHKVTGKLYYASRAGSPPPGPRVRIVKRPDADQA